MPVDTAHGRSYRGRPDPLGPVTTWTCPACGVQNEGRRPEEGCAHCEAGKPGTKGPEPLSPVPRVEGDKGHSLTAPASVSTTERRAAGIPPGPPSVEVMKVYRLIEYIGSPEHLEVTLRRSLVGTITLGPSQVTATIVDEISQRQADLLTMAKRQPGVWLGQPTQLGGFDSRQGGRAPENPAGSRERTVASSPGTNTIEESPMVETPPTGPAFTQEQHRIANWIVQVNLKLAYTLALALQNIVPELEANTEPEKFITPQEALQLANALMQQIPADWTPETGAADANHPE